MLEISRTADPCPVIVGSTLVFRDDATMSRVE
jgi:hypothetical protein